MTMRPHTPVDPGIGDYEEPGIGVALSAEKQTPISAERRPTRTVVGYVHRSAVGDVMVDDVCAALSHAAACSALVLDGVFVDYSADWGRVRRRPGRSALFLSVQRGHLDGVLALSVAHLGSRPETQQAFIRVLTTVGGSLYVVDSQGELATPCAFPSVTPAPAAFPGNGHSTQPEEARPG